MENKKDINKKIDNSKIIDSYILNSERMDKVKSLMKNLPSDTFIDIKKDKNILIPMHPSCKDSFMVVIEEFTKDLSEQEMMEALLKCNTHPEELSKNNIELNKTEWCIMFLLEVYHSITYFAIDQNSYEIIKDPTLYSDLSKVIDSNVDILKNSEPSNED